LRYEKPIRTKTSRKIACLLANFGNWLKQVTNPMKSQLTLKTTTSIPAVDEDVGLCITWKTAAP
jgi:hypothetical protein